MRESVGKVAAYLLAMLASFACDHVLGNSDPMLARLCAVGLSVVELKSIAENLHRITGVDLLAAVVAKLKPTPKA